MAAIKTVQFLPDIFRTDTNRKFLNATLDQLVSEPKFKKLNGYIGRKLSPSYKSTDSYIEEATSDRQNYQLEPSVIIKDPITDAINFTTTYTDILNKIKYYGGLTNNHSRLFDNEYYTYDPKIDLDKFVNFSQYYWLENGPPLVTVTASGVPLNANFSVTYNSTNHSYSFDDGTERPNPVITLARGGTYEFIINEPGNNFYIQSSPSITGRDSKLPNIDTRQVLGVSNNGSDIGTVRFVVPATTAQVKWTSMIIGGQADYATNLSYRDVQGANPDDLNNLLGGLDGITTSLHNKRLIFVNNSLIDDVYWTDVDTVEFVNRNDIYQIDIQADELGVDRILLTSVASIIDNQKVLVRAGEINASKEFYSRLGLLNEVPLITAPLGQLFYQNSNDNDAVGQIRIVDPAATILDVDADIVGQENYTSPTGVVFTNGLKIQFDSTALAPYTNNIYYVQGVGSSIRLVPENELTVPELDYDISNQDYFTIKRSSIDRNAWSRSNRWFHLDVIQSASDYVGTTATFDQTKRASRPIIEFDEDLQLFNSGVEAKKTIDHADTLIKRAYTEVQGVTVYVTGLQGTIANDIPVSVVGKINIGDILVSSTIPGYATAANQENKESRLVPRDANGNYILTVIGRGIDNKEATEGTLATVTPPVGTIGIPVGDTTDINYYYSNIDAICSKTVNLTSGSAANLTEGMTVDQLSGTGVLGDGITIQSVNNSTQITLSDYPTSTGTISFSCSLNGSTDEYATFTSGETFTVATNSRIIFTADDNNNVRNKIYDFTIELVTDALGTSVYKAYIVEAEDSLIEKGHTVIVKDGLQGKKQWHYTGSAWKLSQLKTSVNQHPLFDVVDSNGISFGDASVYNGTSFVGSKIFSYKLGTGTNDTVLGIPLSYKNFVSQGDIQFDNSFDYETFSYLVSTGGTSSANVNSGYIQKNLSRTTCQRQNNWIINQNFSKQYQIYNFIYDGEINLFPIDNAPDNSLIIPNIKVLINNISISSDHFVVTKVVDRLALLIDPDIITVDDVIFALVYSTNVSPNAYYQVPLNFDVNSLNVNLENLTLGQMRNHLITLKNNGLNVVGDVPGNSNLRDIEYKNNSGSILQHSAPLIYAGLFLNHPEMNFVNSIKLANREYSKFKIKFLELAVNLNLDVTDVPGSIDTILSSINSVKNSSFPWYYSDMIPYGDTDKVLIPTYTVLNPAIKSYEITNIFNDSVVSNKSVLVYITRSIDNVVHKTLSIKGKDFVFDQTRPAITFTDTFNLLYGDQIDIIEYNNTDGSYIPETPTKLGLHPKFIPEMYTDNTYRTPINVIQGHDGSITPAFNDYRDEFLLELEQRIYNNIKVQYDTNIFNIADYVPGKFRVTDYSLSEFNQVLSQSFLSWAGTNRVDYTTNPTFVASDAFTWNYKKFTDVINGETLPGTWRSVYRYFYDTDRPHTHPWEMLGFSEKPDYWDNRYGPAPYTGGNAVLWSDLSLGYIHEGSRQGFDTRYQRPNLAFIIPVDDSGNLISPEKILVQDFDSNKANTSYAVGDIGPAELAWRRSSEYAFALQLTLALLKPAKYFALLLNTTTYNRDLVTAQFGITDTKQHITPTLVPIHSYLQTDGTTIKGTGYLNWIRDYIKNLGVDAAADVIKNNLENLNVQLSYKLAGYTDKKYIELLAEQNSPSSINDSVIIPDENYRIELFKGSAVNKVSYSAVVVERSTQGYTVSGYNITNPYFFIIPSQVNNNAYTITVGKERGVVYKDFKKVKYTVPYGTEFNTKQQVVDFLVGYQRYLNSQGFIFNDRSSSLSEQKDWILSAKEFLYWASQGWKSGIIVLSPVSNQLSLYDPESTVDEILNTPFSSRVLDINFKNIIKNDFTVSRESNLFTFKSIGGQVIGFAELDLVQYEHLLILDNITVFKDVIYVPELGNRQYRLKLIGSKTAEWSGSLELPGFVYSSGEVDSWTAGQDYSKGTIIKHKFKYYTALQNITAADQFQTVYWKQISTQELRSGMISNFATNAGSSTNFYDIENQPDNENYQAFSNGLIGFRNRSYFTNLGISNATQSKFYQGFIKQKGTINAINALRGAKFSDLDTGIQIYENWAMRVGEYGATDINQFIEILLDEVNFANNPAPLQFIDDSVVEQTNIPTFTAGDIYKQSDDFRANLFKAETIDEPSALRPLPVAGFVNLDDVDATIFNLVDYQTLTGIVDQIGTGYKIWVARDFNNEWNVFRATPVSGLAFALTYVIDNQGQLTTNQEHGLSAGEIIILKNFDSRFNGVYLVTSVNDSTRFYISLYQNLQNLIDEQTIIGNGILFRLTSLKVQHPYLVDSARPSLGWADNDKVWVNDIDGKQNWAVFNKTSPWDYSKKISLDESQYSGLDHFGQAISFTQNGQFIYAGSPDSNGTGRVSLFKKMSDNSYIPAGFFTTNNANILKFGKKIVNGSGLVAVSAPDSLSLTGLVYIYSDSTVLSQILIETAATPGDQFGESLAMSEDGSYLYIGAPGANKVYCYALAAPRDTNTQSYPDLTTGLNAPTGSRTKFVIKNEIATTVDGPDDIVVRSLLNSSEYIPYIDYSTAATTTISTISTSGLAKDPLTDAVPATSVAYSNLPAAIGPNQFTGNISWRLALSSNITANVGDYITQFIGNTGNARVLANVISSSNVVVDFIGGNIVLASNLGTRVNIANLTSYTTTTANVVSMQEIDGARFNVTRTGTSTAYTVTVTDAGYGYQTGDVLTILGANLGGVTSTNNLTITVAGTSAGKVVEFVTAPASSAKIIITAQPYRYKLISTLPLSAETTGVDNFGISLACNTEGSTLAVGANYFTNDSVTRSGAVFVYHRTITQYITDGISSTYQTPDVLNSVTRVKLNNSTLVEGTDYYLSTDQSIQFNPFNIPQLGQYLKIETNQFILDQVIYSPQGIAQAEQFGTELSMCTTGCNIFATSPNYKESHYYSGIVYRFLNVGRIYGTVTGSVINPVVTAGQSIVINNYNVVLTGPTITDVVNSINILSIPGILASKTADNRLKIVSDVQVLGEKLDVKSGSTGTALDDLGIVPYLYAQQMKHPESTGERFGIAVASDMTTGILVIGSSGADINVPTQIDQDNTLFDSGSTRFGDPTADSGAVYVYNLMSNPFENEDNPSVFSYTQKLLGTGIETGYNFGASLAILDKTIAVGTPSDSSIVANGGSIYLFNNNSLQSGWALYRYKEERADISTITSTFIYNKKTQNIIDFFDILDPAKGKILGIVDQELDYKEDYDPASYNVNVNILNILNDQFYWGKKQVGRTWWDLSVASYIDYEQDQLKYRINNWGSLFPGSQIDIYEWVESEVLPSQYVVGGGDGVPKYANNSSYCVSIIVDPATGIITQKYYYWVRGKTTVEPIIANRSMSTSTLEKYISNPKDQGIPFIAPLARNALSLYNVSYVMTGTDIVLHLETSLARNPNLIHNEYQLVQQGNPNEIIPERIVNKLRDSLVGFNAFGQLVPDPAIGPDNRTGILLRPRQSFFVNKSPALKTFVTSLNSVFAKNPILLVANASLMYAEDPLPTSGIDSSTNSSIDLTYLNTESFEDGYSVLIPADADYNGKWTVYVFNSAIEKFELRRIQSYKTSLFWTLNDWYADTFTQGSIIAYTVNQFADVQKINPVVGDYIKVLDNGNGQWLIYKVASATEYDLVAAQNATLELKPEIYDSTLNSGFDAKVFDLTEFDPQAGVEISKIFDSVYSEIFIKDLSIYFNDIFFALVNYIYSEQKNPDWIFKTSFIDVYHQLRTLRQISSYTKDNQNFYEDYINEVKPYRTKIREYVPAYSADDSATGTWTDFDSPAFYDTNAGVFRSPDVNDSIDASIFATDLYKPYYDNYKYKVTDFFIGNVGISYTIAPNVEISGGGGTGATAITTINGSGQITGVYVTNSGSGYTTTPNVVINGTGTGARAYPLMKNEYFNSNAAISYNTIRNVTTSLKFDRIDYSSNVVQWLANTAYANTVVSGSGSNVWISSGNIIVYNNQTFLATNANISSQSIFDYTRYTKLDTGNVLLTAVDRIEAYYTNSIGRPGKDLAQLMYGIEYPGAQVIGERFNANSVTVTSNVFGFSYIGLSITSANTQQVDFLDLGFNLNNPVKVEALVPFPFTNNGIFNIVSVDHNSLMVSGDKPIESLYNLTVGDYITANVGDYITQANTLANAWVVANVAYSKQVTVIHSVTGFELSPEVISINGVTTLANVQELTAGGTIESKISNLYIDDLLDSNIYSTYLDSALGTRPEDINIVGGAYVDLYSSHAPEELIPGRVYDALEMRVFSNTAGNTATYGYRVFQTMNGNVEYARISNLATATLTANLGITDTAIHVNNASIFPAANPVFGVPGVVFINGEKIHYYQKYDTTKMATAIPWTANVDYRTGTLVSGINSNVYLVLGNIYANASAYINTANLQLVTLNTLAQIRRGVDGTGLPNVHLANSQVVDSSLQQFVPNTTSNTATITGNLKVTANVTWKLTLSSNITANVGDYITQFIGNTGNARVLGSVVSANVVAVDFVHGNIKLASNIGTRVNIANVTSYTTTTANIVAIQPLGAVRSNGNVVLSGITLLNNPLWVPLGTGVGLEGSTLFAAEFIKAEESYIP